MGENPRQVQGVKHEELIKWGVREVGSVAEQQR